MRHKVFKVSLWTWLPFAALVNSSSPCMCDKKKHKDCVKRKTCLEYDSKVYAYTPGGKAEREILFQKCREVEITIKEVK